jgi:hypothetical protein
MIEILPPMGKYKYNTWRILPVKCYIYNAVAGEEASISYLSIDYTG